jgi:hypothetical protein
MQSTGQLTAPAANSRSFFALHDDDAELEAVLQSNPQYNRTNPTPSTHSQRRSITTSASFGASGSGSIHRQRDGSGSSASGSRHLTDANAPLSSGSWHNYTHHNSQHSTTAADSDTDADNGSDNGLASTVAAPAVTGHGVAWGVGSSSSSHSTGSSSGTSGAGGCSSLLRVPEMTPLQLPVPQRRASVAGEEGTGVSPPGSPQKTGQEGGLNRTYSEVSANITA